MSEGLYTDAAALTGIGGNLKSGRFSCYMNVITDKNDSNYLKVYVGKALVLLRRLTDHARRISRRIVSKDPATSYHHWCTYPDSRVVNFVSFGPDPDLFEPLLARLTSEGVEFLTSMLAMSAMIRFQTLPPDTLSMWLPASVEMRDPSIGTNIDPSFGQMRRENAYKDAEYTGYVAEIETFVSSTSVQKYAARPTMSLRPNEPFPNGWSTHLVAHMPQHEIKFLLDRPYSGLERDKSGTSPGPTRRKSSSLRKKRPLPNSFKSKIAISGPRMRLMLSTG